MPENNHVKPYIKNTFTIGIALVWFINGLFCKVLGLVPRHQLIVSRILGDNYAGIATKAIGVLEILMFIWILSRIKSQWCAWIQIAVVAVMNSVEFILVPDLLLFGRANAIVAVIFIGIVFFNEFMINQVNYK